MCCIFSLEAGIAQWLEGPIVNPDVPNPGIGGGATALYVQVCHLAIHFSTSPHSLCCDWHTTLYLLSPTSDASGKVISKLLVDMIVLWLYRHKLVMI